MGRSKRGGQMFFSKCFLRRGVVFTLLLFFWGAGFLFGEEQASEVNHQMSDEYVDKAWAASGAGNFQDVYRITNECIEKFGKEADALAQTLNNFPSQKKRGMYQVMNNVATCYFIQGEAYLKEGIILMKEGKQEQAKEKFACAKKVFLEVIGKYPYAQAWDPRGWYWSIREASQKTVEKIEKGEVIKMGVEPPQPVEKEIKVKLYDYGLEFPVDYEKYGEFIGIGTENYRYVIKDPIGLSRATGEGIYPNTSSIKFDPRFIKIKKKLFKMDQWKLLNSRDLSTAFYRWNLSSEPLGVKQFYIADILQRSGLIKQAVKAYYAILVHFPSVVGWTYWQTPWYVGKVALYRLKFLLRKYPQLNLRLKDAYLEVINGFDNNIRNDKFIVNPGRLVKKSFLDKSSSLKKRKLGRIVERRGGDKVKLVKYESGDWQLMVDDIPFLVKGITYSPTKVGESPDEGTLSNWTTQDTNNNGLIDAPYEAWVDKNRNNIQDKGEERVGDFKLLKDMGVNAIRVYHQPFKLNKEVFKQLFQKYGIYIIMGDFLGKYALGSGANWSEGTNYNNPQHQKNMLESVRKMVLEFKDEPYILFWLLGNENVYGIACNADKKPRSFFKFANKAAQLIKSLDPLKRPVAIASGDTLYLNLFAEECPDVDIFGTNVYRGKYGFLDLWDSVKKLVDKPVIITEYGCPSYARGYTDEEGEIYQAEYHQNAWEDIYYNSCGYGAGNSIGGIAFEWLDEWWKAYEPYYHDRKGLFAGPFLDGYMHEEWLGICSQGDGRSSPFLRQLKKVYFTYKELWNKD